MTALLQSSQPLLAVLIDPDHRDHPNYETLLIYLRKGLADLILVGGSTSKRFNVDLICRELKQSTDLPVLLFPGNHFQLSPHADALMALSLISGRNPEYLIGKMVEAASIIREYQLATIPTGYILVGTTRTSATAYITNTQPIPVSQPNIIAQTALAGQLLGMKTIYLEGGSGSEQPISTAIVNTTKKSIEIPLIVGGGIQTPHQMMDLYAAGADVVVLGSILEQKPEMLDSFYKVLIEDRIVYD